MTRRVGSVGRCKRGSYRNAAYRSKLGGTLERCQRRIPSDLPGGGLLQVSYISIPLSQVAKYRSEYTL